MAKAEKPKEKTVVPKKEEPVTNTPEKKGDDWFPEEVHIKEVSIKKDVKREEAITILIDEHKKSKT